MQPVVDAVPLLPSALQTNLAHQIRAFYVSSYNDKFFAEAPPPWFTAFIAMELFYHAPLSLWAIPALIRDNAMVPVHLLAFGVQAFVTSLACLVQVWSWEDRTVEQKRSITMLYGPYVALGMNILLCVRVDCDGCADVCLGAFMALDMVFRLRGRLLGKRKLA
jgi:hypothetical protein